MSGPPCLCGHFESCKFCRTQPPSEEQLARTRAMSAEDWARATPITLDRRHDSAFAAHMGAAVGRECDRIVADVVAKRFDLATCTPRG